MHPNTFKNTLFDYSLRDEIFVIMSFAAEFQGRWERVIEPAIREELNLTPIRVDYNNSGESIVHDILDGIAHARLVLADITSTAMIDRHGVVWPQRNGNVMWELGIAHTMRLPDEVIVIRSDNDDSLFDLTQFRAFPFDPGDITEARRLIVSLARDRLRTVDQSRADYVQRCAEALDATTASILLNGVPPDGTPVVVLSNMGNALTLNQAWSEARIA